MRTRTTPRSWLAVVGTLAVVATIAPPAVAQGPSLPPGSTQIVSLADDGSQGDDLSSYDQPSENQQPALLNMQQPAAFESMPVASGAAEGSWSIVSSPNSPQPASVLSAVACVSASDCWAVGSSWVYTVGPAPTLIEHWDGTSWSIIPSPNRRTDAFNVLNDVTCVSATDCWAVGGYQGFDGTVGGNPHSLIMRWDGTSWTIVPEPNASDSIYNQLFAVTCVSSSDCWAVGETFTDSTQQVLIEHWDGTAWTIVDSPSTVQPFVRGVTCVSADDCWLVGSANGGTLVEHWDGIAWAIVPSPNVDRTNRLTGVTCVSAQDCWAVGHASGLDPVTKQTSPARTLIARWNGTAWSIIASPNSSATNANLFSGVTCTSATNCWTVGSYYAAGGAGTGTGVIAQTLIQRWDGTSWAIVTSPNARAAQDNVLNDVTCVSASDCWTVGYVSPANVGVQPESQTLIEHFTVPR